MIVVIVSVLAYYMQSACNHPLQPQKQQASATFQHTTPCKQAQCAHHRPSKHELQSVAIHKEITQHWYGRLSYPERGSQEIPSTSIQSAANAGPSTGTLGYVDESTGRRAAELEFAPSTARPSSLAGWFFYGAGGWAPAKVVTSQYTELDTITRFRAGVSL